MAPQHQKRKFGFVQLEHNQAACALSVLWHKPDIMWNVVIIRGEKKLNIHTSGSIDTFEAEGEKKNRKGYRLSLIGYRTRFRRLCSFWRRVEWA